MGNSVVSPRSQSASLLSAPFAGSLLTGSYLALVELWGSWIELYFSIIDFLVLQCILTVHL